MGTLRAHTVAVAAATLLVARGAAASPEDLFGFGPRGVAMGGTGTSYANDFGAVYANPAALSRARGAQLTLGFAGALYDLRMARGAAPEAYVPVEHARAIQVGLTVPMPFAGIARDRVVLGLGLHLPTDVIARNRVLLAETPQFLLLEHRAQAIGLQLGLGFDLGRGFRIGAGGAVLAALSGSLTIQQDPTGTIAYHVDDRIVASYGALAGLSWEHGPFRIGAVYRGPRVAQLRVQVEARDLGLSLPVFNIAGISQYDPTQFALEVAFAQGPWTAALGATYKLWSEYPGPLEATTRGSPTPPAPGFGNTLAVRAGLEHRFAFEHSFVTLRGGYIYEPTPAPAATGVANYLDNDRHVGTFGVALGGSTRGTTLTLELFGQLHALVPRTQSKSADVPGDNPGAPSIRTSGWLYVVGLAATVNL